MSGNPEPSSLAARKSRKAALVRHRGALDPKTLNADAELREALLEAHINKVVRAWPPLSPEQRDRLAILLRGGDAA